LQRLLNATIKTAAKNKDIAAVYTKPLQTKLCNRFTATVWCSSEKALQKAIATVLGSSRSGFDLYKIYFFL
jgi:hypothetical protein